jgi:uncharacterized membrane protein
MQGTRSRQLCTLGNSAQPHRYHPISMNLKRIFGALLTVLGIVGLIYGAVMFVNDSKAIKALIMFSVLGLGFFIAGIGLIRTTKDEA